MAKKEIHDCRTCCYMRKMHERLDRGIKVLCMPPDYYGSQAMRGLPRIVTDDECSRFKLSAERLKELCEDDGKKNLPDSVMLAIKPEWADRIYSLKKRWEYRPVLWSQEGIRKAVMYESLPKKAVTGEFSIGEVIKGTPEDVWKDTGKESGMTKDQFMTMFESKPLVYAIRITNPKRYQDTKTVLDFGLAFIPQSFAYIPKD